MLRYFKKFILTTLFAVFASQASALFIQADWWDPSDPRVGTNRYAYSHNDPINLADPGGNAPDYGYGTENSYHTGVQEPSTSYNGSSHGSQVSHYDHVYIGNETGNVYRDGNGLQSQPNSASIARTHAALEDLAQIHPGLGALAGLSSGELTGNQAMNMANTGTVNGGIPTAGPLPQRGFRSLGASVNTTVNFYGNQIQRKFKHAADFGIQGNYNRANASAFRSAIQRHAADPNTKVLQGTYREL